MYGHRSLPYIIGTPAFMQDDDVGLMDISEEGIEFFYFFKQNILKLNKKGMMQKSNPLYTIAYKFFESCQNVRKKLN